MWGDIEIQKLIRFVAEGFEAAGVLALLIGTSFVTGRYGWSLLKRPPTNTTYYLELREGLGRTILLGLELLVAADIVRTVAVYPTLERLGALAIIIALRIILSITLEMEIDGRWPWQRKKNEQRHERAAEEIQ